ncbi:hypothetical protein P691DRAFT_821134 [Macrolepiota fuliginosa MF-IS2]|uniref:Uncharacterized protein n=1 Tax=Macrolepiota fuliginosa MF-IS2 TaxID=1400762 RepID=A0A9P6BV76_9AGAR|nr:hypothetical protein P691DRAFT_821134 [Macrolepiota fuliginosa MF-IS2]
MYTTPPYARQLAPYIPRPVPYNAQPSPYNTQPSPYTPRPALYIPQHPSQPSRYATRTYPIAPAIPLPQETFDTPSLQQILTSDTFLARLAGKMALKTYNMHQMPYRHPIQQNPPQQQPNWPCGFCLDPDHMHGHGQCLHLEDYIRRDLCIRDVENRICMLDGDPVSVQTAPGQNMQERIDIWRNQVPAITHVQENVLQASSTRPVNPMTVSGPYSPSVSYSIRSDSQDENGLVRLEAIALANMKRQDDIRKWIGNVGETENVPVNNAESTNGSQSTLIAPSPQISVRPAPVARSHPPQNPTTDPASQ